MSKQTVSSQQGTASQGRKLQMRGQTVGQEDPPVPSLQRLASAREKTAFSSVRTQEARFSLLKQKAMGAAPPPAAVTMSTQEEAHFLLSHQQGTSRQ
ncbi:hypothetical protein EWB00_001634 [Schistosoma japonicum]|uniref:Uncharacterized protein n=1 Tax=Schistosoma japonicum TaxID=6182 RepID=A0A4Z2CK28_SCHJA|nr:hypothetical protein EWB00_001634 [Schistosoma japonicum]